VRDDVWAATKWRPATVSLWFAVQGRDLSEARRVRCRRAAPNAPSEPAEASDVEWSFLRNTSDADTLCGGSWSCSETATSAGGTPARRGAGDGARIDAAPSGAIFSLASDETTLIEEEDVKTTRPIANRRRDRIGLNLLKDSQDATVVGVCRSFPSSRRRAPSSSDPSGSSAPNALPTAGSAPATKALARRCCCKPPKTPTFFSASGLTHDGPDAQRRSSVIR